jgi:hypothetical protein
MDAALGFFLLFVVVGLFIFLGMVIWEKLGKPDESDLSNPEFITQEQYWRGYHDYHGRSSTGMTTWTHKQHTLFRWIVLLSLAVVVYNFPDAVSTYFCFMAVLVFGLYVLLGIVALFNRQMRGEFTIRHTLAFLSLPFLAFVVYKYPIVCSTIFSGAVLLWFVLYLVLKIVGRVSSWRRRRRLSRPWEELVDAVKKRDAALMKGSASIAL